MEVDLCPEVERHVKLKLLLLILLRLCLFVFPEFLNKVSLPYNLFSEGCTQIFNIDIMKKKIIRLYFYS